MITLSRAFGNWNKYGSQFTEVIKMCYIHVWTHHDECNHTIQIYTNKRWK